MPTGYTADVQSGKVTTLRGYALACARAFGALITMRDDPHDTPIPAAFEANTKYHDERIAEAEATLAAIPALADDECAGRAAAAFLAAVESRASRESERIQQKLRYEAMIRAAEQWTPPESLSGLRDFMIKQLRESIEFDCSDKYWPDPPKPMTAEAWRLKELGKAAEDLAYHTKGRAEEIGRTQECNRWLAALWASLPPAAR